MVDEGKTYKVQLYVYDLSQGMASSMSMAMIGKQIDGIWHTGLVVYGKEYFYGGGISWANPGTTPFGKQKHLKKSKNIIFLLTKPN